MLLIPAIDLKDGHCVRLQQGDMEASTTFGEDPAAMARRWLDAGARRLHLVDLNGAFAGKPVNEGAVKAILRELDGAIPVDELEEAIDASYFLVVDRLPRRERPAALPDR